MPRYEIPVWKMCDEASKNLPEIFSPIDVIKEIHKKYPDVKKNTIRCHVIGCTPNHPSYKHYSTNKNFFKYLSNGKFCLTDKDVEGLEIVQEAEEDEEESIVFSYEFEADLKYHIASNLEDLEKVFYRLRGRAENLENGDLESCLSLRFCQILLERLRQI